MKALTITKENYNREVAEQEKPALVEFWAPWCTYCRRIGPVMDKVAEQYQDALLVGQINIDDEPGLAEKFDVEVIPTLIMYKDGKAAGRIVAPDSKAKIDLFISEQIGQ